MSGPPLERRPGRMARLGVGCILSGALGLSFYNLGHEWAIARAGGLAAGATRWTDPPPPAAIPPRAALAYGALATRLAAETADPAARGRYLDLADRYLTPLETARSHWGQFCAADIFRQLVRYGATAHPTIAALDRSFDCAPYLDTASTWRLRVGLEAWPRLPVRVRNAVMMEASWMGSLSARQSILIRSIVGFAPDKLRAYHRAQQRFNEARARSTVAVVGAP
ncbi:hypothetical protein [Sphingomonas sp.]|uniref:hypothetical protein n=1 Tax=Sphingomonas sp. TaxID=28214 RepID=UPI0031DE6EF3